jgi:IS30 family transposase
MKAEKSTWTRAKRPKLLKLERYPQLKRTVQRKLEQKWSPEQIAGWLRQTYTDDEDMRVSHESIYKSLFLQARGGLKRELTRHLRSGRVLRQSRKNNYRGSPRGGGLNLPSISERPAEAEDRAIPGHWEGDLISGSQNTHIATLVERKSRYAMMVKIKGKDTESVVSALIKIVKRLPSELRKTLTWDRGMELKKHIDFTLATDMKVYFCDPQSPWQRGSNENTNRLIRQYLPRKTDLSVHTQAELNKICQELNSRPRKTLGYKTPAEVLSEVLH